MREVRATLSLHTVSEQNQKDHGDLFLDLPEFNKLLTFHIDYEFLEKIQHSGTTQPGLQAAKSAVPVFTLYPDRLPGEPLPGTETAGPFQRKQDQRKKYMDYEGPVSENRGSIRILRKDIVRVTGDLLNCERAFLVWTE